MLGKYLSIQNETVQPSNCQTQAGTLQPKCQKMAEVSKVTAVKPHNDNKIQKHFESELVKNVFELLSISHTLTSPLARFDISMEAALHNYQLLKRYSFNLEKVIRSELGTNITTPSSEFLNQSQS